MHRIFPVASAALAALLLLASWPSNSVAQPPDSAKVTEKAPLDPLKMFKQFEENMAGVKLVGRFTVIGKEGGPLAQEEYTITSVKKLDEGDYWLINTRIKYGKNDVTVPLPLEVKWAGDTPVITLSNTTIPGLGTFSSRVVIDGRRYAGTWTHGEVGGHLFGTIEKIKATDPVPEKAPDAKP